MLRFHFWLNIKNVSLYLIWLVIHYVFAAAGFSEGHEQADTYTASNRCNHLLKVSNVMFGSRGASLFGFINLWRISRDFHIPLRVLDGVSHCFCIIGGWPTTKLTLTAGF